MAGVDDGEVITRGKIFISYRRSDDPGFALFIHERLEQEFGGANLFMDVEGHIKPGDDFVKVLNDWVAQCDVLLAIIGEDWIGARDEDGNRRLEKESDFVRIEIASALKLGKRVIPVLVNKAEMPRADELPESLKPLARRNAVAIRPTRSKADREGLVKALRDALAAADVEIAARTEAARKTIEEEYKWRAAEEEARAAQVEAAATKAQAEAGLTPEQIREAKELANWNFIKDNTNPAEFRDHLARFAAGETDRFARKKLEGLLWADPGTRSSIEALRKFLNEFPKGDYAADAQADLARLEREAEKARQAEEQKRAETEAWATVAASTVIADFEAFLKQWPKGTHAADAKARIRELRGSGKTLKLWDLATGKEIRTFAGHEKDVNSVAFSPDGRTALSGSQDKTLKRWDLAIGKEIRTFTGHAGGVPSVAFSPDGRTALSGSDDNTLKLWDLATGKTIRTFTGHTDWVRSVAFSPDGRTALSGSDDKTLKLWDLSPYLPAAR